MVAHYARADDGSPGVIEIGQLAERVVVALPRLCILGTRRRPPALDRRAAVVSGRSVEYATSVVERTYKASPERAFAAWADPTAKARWFADSEASLELDFRVGGRERNQGTAPDGNPFSYEALYHDIVPAQRIVYTYDMYLEETRISVSLASVEFTPVAENGTRLVFTEQGAFLDGHEFPARRADGWGSLLDPLEKEIQGDTPGD